jgi:hypothetical protein
MLEGARVEQLLACGLRDAVKEPLHTGARPPLGDYARCGRRTCRMASMRRRDRHVDLAALSAASVGALDAARRPLLVKESDRADALLSQPEARPKPAETHRVVKEQGVLPWGEADVVRVLPVDVVEAATLL